MNTKIQKLFIILTLLTLLSGCTSGSFSFFNSKPSNEKEKDITGTGLLIDLEIDKTFVDKKLNYHLSIENSGSEPITLTQNNLKFYTTQKDTSGKINAFTTESIQNLKNKIFEDGPIELPQNSKIAGIVGQLQVADWIYQNSNIKQIDYTFEITYRTKTKFSNNLEIQKLEKIPLKVVDKISQAAPVQITAISARPFQDDTFYIDYTITDKASNNLPFIVKLENFAITLGSESIYECGGFIKKDNSYQRLPEPLQLTKTQTNINYICKVDFSRFSNTKSTTTTSGEFEYEYSHIKKDTITLPKKRETEDLFA